MKMIAHHTTFCPELAGCNGSIFPVPGGKSPGSSDQVNPRSRGFRYFSPMTLTRILPTLLCIRTKINPTAINRTQQNQTEPIFFLWTALQPQSQTETQVKILAAIYAYYRLLTPNCR